MRRKESFHALKNSVASHTVVVQLISHFRLPDYWANTKIGVDI